MTIFIHALSQKVLHSYFTVSLHSTAVVLQERHISCKAIGFFKHNGLLSAKWLVMIQSTITTRRRSVCVTIWLCKAWATLCSVGDQKRAVLESKLLRHIVAFLWDKRLLSQKIIIKPVVTVPHLKFQVPVRRGCAII